MAKANGAGGRKEAEQTSTVMAVDVCFKLCSRLKIVFDINARTLDNKIKSCIILRVF